MGWEASIKFMDSSVAKILGGVSVTFTPQDASGDQIIKGIIKTPGMDEEFVPGAGTSVLRLWVKITSITPQPRNGDLFSIGGISYLVQVPPDVDSQGGATLKLRAC